MKSLLKATLLTLLLGIMIIAVPGRANAEGNADPFQDIPTISLSEETKTYTTTVVSSKAAYNYRLYKLDVTEDAMLNISDYNPSSYGDELYLFEMEGAPTSSNDVINADKIKTLSYNNVSIKNYALNKGTYYIALHGSDGHSFSFKLQLRKYRHAVVKWSIKEGPVDSAFKQNQQLHVTFEITNADSDAYISPLYGWLAQGHSEDNKVTVSNNGKKGEFIFITNSFPTVSTVQLTVQELNPEPEEGKVNDQVFYTLDITTGMAMTDIAIEAGPDYILFPDFRSPQFSQDGSTKINVYLKSGKKWKKKFTAEAGSKTPKKIKKLKAKTKYQVKVEIEKTVAGGKSVKTSKTYKVKTGPKTKPAIQYATVNRVWNEKKWVPGHFNASGRWEKGYYSNNKYYSMTITLKKSLKGCKGIVVNGQKVKGTGTSFTFTVAHSDPPKKISVKGYTDDKFYGYTKASKSVKVK